MLFGLLRALARIRITVAYTATLAGVSTALMTQGPQAQSRIVSHASTNLHNLSRGHLGTLFVSAVVIDAGPIYVWLPGLVCLLAVVELLWRGGRLVAAFAAGHIGATLLVAIGLTAAVELGWMSSDVTRASDVGMSYGASAVLGALTAAIPGRWRPAWTGWWIAVAFAVVGMGMDFTGVGHAVALLLGMVVGTRFGQAGRWTAVRCLLLAVAAFFGFLMLAGSGLTLIVLATWLGMSGAVLAEVVVGRRRGREEAARADALSCGLRQGVA
jgi:hypothetical protein